jgi:hypothetical protein
MFTSCDDFLDVNQDPDAPTDEQMTEAVYLPGILGYASYRGLEYSNYLSAHWMLHIAAYGYNAGGQEQFDVRPSDTDYYWLLYTQSIKNSKRMLDMALTNNNFYYQGIAQVMLAHQFSTLTDMFGDVPMSEALILGKDLPKFDSQEVIYAQIIKWLEEAIDNFEKTEGGMSPGGDDLLYGGNIEKWNKFANSLKARYLMRLYYRDNSYAERALIALAEGFASVDDNAAFKYSNEPNQQSYWFQYSVNWTWHAKLYPTIYFVDLLKDSNDPRLNKLFTKNSVGDFVGHISGTEADDISSFQPFLYAAEGPGMFMSYQEVKFLEAEALLLSGASIAEVQTSLNESITSDMLELGVSNVDIEAYLARPELNLSNVANMENRQAIIMNQKYIALFMENSEVYNDWRRTGYPEFTSEIWEANMDHGGFVNTTAPIRYLYPLSSYQRNPENTPRVNVWKDKVWWDAK